MECMSRQIDIYAPFGQKYKRQDSHQLLYCREYQKGLVLQQGISELRVFGGFLRLNSFLHLRCARRGAPPLYPAVHGKPVTGDDCCGDTRHQA